MKRQVLKLIILFAIILAFVLAGCLNKTAVKKEQKVFDLIKKNNAAFTSKVLDEYNNGSNLKASNVVEKTVNEMNEVTSNPFNKKQKAFTYDLNCTNCTTVEFQDSQNSIILTTLDKKGKLIARTVIKPPSYVTYTK